jgi:hypothetical protein
MWCQKALMRQESFVVYDIRVSIHSWCIGKLAEIVVLFLPFSYIINNTKQIKADHKKGIYYQINICEQK